MCEVQSTNNKCKLSSSLKSPDCAQNLPNILPKATKSIQTSSISTPVFHPSLKMYKLKKMYKKLKFFVFRWFDFEEFFVTRQNLWNIKTNSSKIKRRTTHNQFISYMRAILWVNADLVRNSCTRTYKHIWCIDSMLKILMLRTDNVCSECTVVYFRLYRCLG